MEPVMLLEIRDDHGHLQFRQRIAGAGAVCRIGRSLACDVVVDDPFVAAEHVLLTLRADGRVYVQDLATRNGIQIDGQLIDPDGGRIIAGGELRLGRTRLRLRTGEAPLAPERPYRRDFLRQHRTMLAVAGLLLCATFAAFLQWTLAPAHLATRMLIAELVALAGLAIWVGTWSLVARLTVGAWRVRIHLAIAAICVGMWAWGYWLYGVAAFAMQWRWLGAVMVMLAGVVALLATALHLRHATNFGRLPSAALAVLATLLCYGVWWLVELQLDPRTVNRVQLGARIYPPSLRVAPSMDAGDYFMDAAALKREANRNRQESLLENPILDVEE
jgi:hypothetical protein